MVLSLHFSRATRSVLNARDMYGIVLSFGRGSFLFKAVRCHEWHVSEGAVARDTKDATPTRSAPVVLNRWRRPSSGTIPRSSRSARCTRERNSRLFVRVHSYPTLPRQWVTCWTANETGEISCSDAHSVKRDTVLFWSRLLPWGCSTNNWYNYKIPFSDLWNILIFIIEREEGDLIESI